MKHFPTLVLALAALAFLGFGLWLLADPGGALGRIGIQAHSITGLVELRAFYGGMEVGLGLFLGACALRPGWRVAGLWLVLLSSGGAGCARLAGMLQADTGFGGYLAGALAWELGFALLAALALLRKPT